MYHNTKSDYRLNKEKQNKLTKITIAFFLLAILLTGFCN